MSRRTEADPGVGSDAFLDVIANIVGILIILIVVAGVRVSRAPVAVVAPPESSAATPEVQGDDQSPGVPDAEDSSSEADVEPIVAAEP
ncbi:MAG TPA: hypothetical protein VML55_07925, partial [Planctomycetaceae bacterium]|nr:hypothetical protein [Planctomycetaceae bacterium]